MPAHRKYFTEEEVREAKREANARYSQTAKCKEARSKRDRTDTAKARYARYRETDGYAAAQERRRVKNIGRPSRPPGPGAVYERTPERMRAWAAVSRAIRSGALTRAERCSTCPRTTSIVAHHPLGYEPPNDLVVLWVCRKCHKRLHMP